MRLKVTISSAIKDLGHRQRFIFGMTDPSQTVRAVIRNALSSVGVAADHSSCEFFMTFEGYALLNDCLVSEVLRAEDQVTIDITAPSESIPAMIQDTVPEDQRQWKKLDRCPLPEEWICYRPKEIDFLSGQEYWASEFKVAQVLWVDTQLRKTAVLVVREGLEGDGAFDTIQLSDLTDLHCCSQPDNLEIITPQPRSPADRRMVKLKGALRRQIEWYLSPVNLKSDSFLLQLISENSCSVPVDVFLKFPRISDITDDLEIVTLALTTSKRLRVEDGRVFVPSEDILPARKLQLLDLLD